MEAGLSIIMSIDEAPPRTLNNPAIVRSSPLPLAVRTMFEARQFGRRYDEMEVDLGPLASKMPGLTCPAGDVLFLASDRSLDDLNFSVDCLLQHRKQLLAASLNPGQPRRHVLILGAGPAGLMAAVQLSLRGHRVVICEQRELYSRNRYIGVYKEVTHLLASLGMPESMTYDFSQYRGKRGIMLADIQTFLHGIALKLGAVIYSGAVVRDLSLPLLQGGAVELQRDPLAASSASEHSAIGILRWRHDTIARVRSGVTIRFDTIVEATGGRSGLRELLVGADNVVSLRTVGKAAALRDPSLQSFFDDPEDHCAEYVESGYGCPPGTRELFARALLSGAEAEIPDELPCFVSNIDASIFVTPMQATPGSMGLASRIAGRQLDIPHDWVVLECRLADQSLSRYHIEGPLPQSFDFGGRRLATRQTLDTLNPVTLLFRILYAMGVPFDAVDRRRLIDFHTSENSFGDTSDIVSTWVGRFRGLRLGGTEPIWRGTVPGSERVEYAVIGEALQNAWYRFGVGVDDSFAGAWHLAEGFELSPETRREQSLRFERVMTSRSVQVLYHLFSVARHTDQGIVGPVLTEYHMDEQRVSDLAEARLRSLTTRGAQVVAAHADVQAADPDRLLDRALEHERATCCRSALTLLQSLSYPHEPLSRAQQIMKSGGADWRSRAFAAIEHALSQQHRELLEPLFQRTELRSPRETATARRAEERLIELALGRYAWLSPWGRACAVRALDAASPAALDACRRTASDPNPLVAETAAAKLQPANESAAADSAARRLTIDKVLMLRTVSLFEGIQDETLAGVAGLLTERWAEPGERIIEKGDIGDCLYLIESGRLRVEDGGRLLAYLEPHHFFGELSLLDAEPRSASVVAAERSRLYRLDQSDFYSLVTERPEIARAINRVLCKMVRTANAS